MAHISPYYLNYNRIPYPNLPAGWVQIGDKTLVPQDFNLGYSKSFQKKNFWNDRISFTNRISSSLLFDLQRYTYSKLTFSYGMDFEISRFIVMKFNISSENTQIYRYFQGLPFFTSSVPIPSSVETNFFVDLLNSFRFDSENLRRESAFKLKSFSLDVVHHLGDWDATLGITLSPYLDSTAGTLPSWKFNNQISFLVKWVPIEEVRTQITHDKDRLGFN
jgi:hypothetical protein